jgi:hypothetical protein
MSLKKIYRITSLFILFLILSSSMMQQSGSKAKIKFLIGKAEVQSQEQVNWRDAKINMPIVAGDRIRTTLNSRVELEMPDGSIIKVNENSTFDVKELKTAETDREDKMSFTLWAGNIWAQFKKVVSSRQVREIESPSAVVAIRGTILGIDVDQEQTTTVRVFEGSVSVLSKEIEGEVIVGMNQESTVRRGTAPTSPQMFQPDQESQEEGQRFPFRINTTQLQFTDPAVLLAGVPVNGRTLPGSMVTANGIPLTVDGSGNFSGRVRVQEGLNEILFEAKLNDRKKTTNLRLFVNTKKPVVKLSKPIVAGFLNRRDYSLSGAVFDLTPKDKVKVFLNDELVTEVFGRGSFNRTIILNEGKNEIKIRAEDLSGNVYETAEQIFLDTVKPIITITEPPQQVASRFEPPRPPDQNLSAAAVRYTQQIRGLVIDPEPSSKIKRIAINGKEVKPNSDGSFETEIEIGKGENRLSIYAEDIAGNIARDNSRVIWVR